MSRTVDQALADRKKRLAAGASSVAGSALRKDINKKAGEAQFWEEFRAKFSSAADPAALGAGWLMKRGAKNKAFKNRFFVLKKKHLLYYKDAKQKKPAGAVQLEASSVSLTQDDGNWRIELEAPLQDRVFVLGSKDGVDALRPWYEALTRIKKL